MVRRTSQLGGARPEKVESKENNERVPAALLAKRLLLSANILPWPEDHRDYLTAKTNAVTRALPIGEESTLGLQLIAWIAAGLTCGDNTTMLKTVRLLRAGPSRRGEQKTLQDYLEMAAHEVFDTSAPYILASPTQVKIGKHAAPSHYSLVGYALLDLARICALCDFNDLPEWLDFDPMQVMAGIEHEHARVAAGRAQAATANSAKALPAEPPLRFARPADARQKCLDALAAAPNGIPRHEDIANTTGLEHQTVKEAMGKLRRADHVAKCEGVWQITDAGRKHLKLLRGE